MKKSSNRTTLPTGITHTSRAQKSGSTDVGIIFNSSD